MLREIYERLWEMNRIFLLLWKIYEKIPVNFTECGHYSRDITLYGVGANVHAGCLGILHRLPLTIYTDRSLFFRFLCQGSNRTGGIHVRILTCFHSLRHPKWMIFESCVYFRIIIHHLWRNDLFGINFSSMFDTFLYRSDTVKSNMAYPISHLIQNLNCGKKTPLPQHSKCIVK